MSSENSRDRVDYKNNLPDNQALENHADRLIDELFADIDDILEDGTKVPSKSDYPALKNRNVPQVSLPPGTYKPNVSTLPPAGRTPANPAVPPLGYAQASSPQDRMGSGSPQAPTLIPDATPDPSPDTPQLHGLPQSELESHPDAQAEEPIPDAIGDRIPVPPAPTRPPSLLDRLLLWGTIATFASLAALFFLWLISQYRLNVLRTANTNSQTAPVTQEEKEFIDYMQRSLKTIDQKTTPIAPQPVPPVPSTSIPVLTPGLPSVPSQFTPQTVPIPVPEAASPSTRR